MDTMTIIFWIFGTLNFGFAGLLSFYFQHLLNNNKIFNTKAKKCYSLIYGFFGFLFSTGFFYVFLKVFNINIGHGEILVIFPIFNLLLTFVLIFCGRMIIEWEPLKW